MDELISRLNGAIEGFKDDFADVEAKYNNAFPHGVPGHDLTLDLAMEELKCAHQHFESVCNDGLPLSMDELIVKWPKLNVAIERCKDDLAAMEAEYNKVLQHGIVERNSALDTAMEYLNLTHLCFESVCNNATLLIDANAVQPTAAEPETVRSVVANVSEEHNTAAIPERTAENNMAAPEEMKTVEDNLHQLALDPNKKD